jgi:hypothetical protein
VQAARACVSGLAYTWQDNSKRLVLVLLLKMFLGVPVVPEKCAGPAEAIVFLGFELDTRSMVVRLPQAKLQRTLRLVQEWLEKRACRKRELESLLGHLQHAATVVRPGRTFVRRLIELVASFRNKLHWIRLTESTRSDLYWWYSFMDGWNGISMMPGSPPVELPLESDASGLRGPLGEQMVPVEMGGPGGAVGYRTKGAVANPVCVGGMGKEVARAANRLPL